MKKIIVLCLALVLVVSLVGCSKPEEKKIEFPFAVGDVENVELFRSAVPVSAEKKVVTESADIESLYNLFERLTYTTKEVEEYTGATVYSFRFNLSDGTNYVLVYVENGVKNGVLRSPTADFRYFTSADLGGPWFNLNENYETISIEESELPGNPPVK